MNKEVILRFISNTASKRDWMINPDNDLVQDLADGLLVNLNRYGYLLCPCRDCDDQPDNKDITCPCAYSKEDIAEYGQCYCGLYLRKDLNLDVWEHGSIPERRSCD